MIFLALVIQLVSENENTEFTPAKHRLELFLRHILSVSKEPGKYIHHESL